MATWTAERITADAVDNMQTAAGLLLNNFDVSTPKEPADEDIVCATSGGFHVVCKPTPNDILADVDGAPKDTMEGKRNDGWECEFSTTALSVTTDTLKMSLGAAEDTVSPAAGVTPRRQFAVADFKTLYWIGDMMDPTKLLVIKLENSLSVGGLDFTTADDAKGKMALTIKPHVSIKSQDKIPMSFYILTKQGVM